MVLVSVASCLTMCVSQSRQISILNFNPSKSPTRDIAQSSNHPTDSLDLSNKKSPIRLSSLILPPLHPEHLHSIIWTAYLMMLENEGKNEIQLREFAKLDEWIFKHWFASDGTSFARVNLLADVWPESSPVVSASMWLVCLFFRAGARFASLNSL